MAADKETSWLIKLIDQVTGPLKKIHAATKAPFAGFKAMTAQTEKLQSSFSGLGRVVAGIGLGVSLLGLSQDSMAFEKGMAMVNTVMEASPEKLASVSNEVRELSKTMAVPRMELVDGLNAVVQAGVPAGNAIGFLSDSTKAAIGGQANLATVVETTVGILNTYGMAWNEAGAIQNKMQQAVKIGVMSLQEFASALPNVTTLASSLGINIDEVAGAFAAMSGNTGGAAEVSTQLASIMSGLIDPTSQAIQMAKQLNIQFDAMSVKRAGGLSNFLNDLMPRIEQLSKSTGQTKEGIIAKLFGRKEAIIGVLAMTGNLKDSWKSATDSMINSSNAVGKAFEENNNTPAAKLIKMQNSIKAGWDQIYIAVVPVFAALITGFSSVVGWVGQFISSHPNLIKMVGAVALLEIGMIAFTASTGAAAGAWQWFMASMQSSALYKVIGLVVTLGASVLGLQAPFWAATSSTWALNAALNAFPLMWIVTAIGAVIAAVVLMIKYWDDVKAWFVGFGKWMYDHMPFKWVIELVQTWLPSLKAAWNALWEGMKAAIKPVADFLDMVWQKIKLLISAIKFFWQAMTKALDLPENLDFRAYGAVTGKETAEKVVATADGAAPAPGKGTKAANYKGLNVSGGTKAGIEMSGGAKGAAIVNFKNVFDIKITGAEGDLRAMTDKIISRITDQLSDATLVAANQ